MRWPFRKKKEPETPAWKPKRGDRVWYSRYDSLEYHGDPATVMTSGDVVTIIEDSQGDISHSVVALTSVPPKHLRPFSPEDEQMIPMPPKVRERLDWKAIPESIQAEILRLLEHATPSEALDLVRGVVDTYCQGED